MPTEFINVRQGKIGTIEYKSIIPRDDDKCRYININEWWNGEGVDIFFMDEDGDEDKISMDFDDWRALKQLMEQFHDDVDDEDNDIISRIGIGG
jgi:hypothetical protein